MRRVRKFCVWRAKKPPKRNRKRKRARFVPERKVGDDVEGNLVQCRYYFSCCLIKTFFRI